MTLWHTGTRRAVASKISDIDSWDGRPYGEDAGRDVLLSRSCSMRCASPWLRTRHKPVSMGCHSCHSNH